jgi:hypothetical protein
MSSLLRPYAALYCRANLEGARHRGKLSGIQAVRHRIGELRPLDGFLRLFESVHGCGHQPDATPGELLDVFLEISQLLKAVGSPLRHPSIAMQ